MKHLLAALALAGAALGAAAVPAGAAGERADLILVGAPVHTMNVAQPRAHAVAVAGERIVAVGTRERVMARRGAATRVVELSPQWCILPGFIDAHGHLHNLGRSLRTVSLMGTSSMEACAERVRERARSTPSGAWIEGRGWDQNDWEEMTFPTWRDLAGTESHPVYLRRVDGHAVWVNRAALELAGITRETPDPPGGRIVRDATGDPTGVLIDNAVDLVRIPEPTPEQIDGRLRAALDHCTRLGLVGVHDAGTTAAELASFERIGRDRGLDLRVYVMLSGADADLLAEWFGRGPGTLAGGRVTVGAVKLYADGALGSRGAALLEPYDDDPGNTGLLVTSRAELTAVSARAADAGFQVCTHAIGDRGNRVALEVYADVLGSSARERDHRFRIEHCQVVAGGDFARFAALGVIASMQPTHATSDMPWAEARVGGERIAGAYAWRRFLDLGVPLALGSDFPVEHANPVWGIYAAVTRQDHRGHPEGGWNAGQALSAAEAVRGFTATAAYAAFVEDDRGILAEGYLADIVVMDRDLLSVESSLLLDASAVYTIVGGEVVWDAASQ